MFETLLLRILVSIGIRREFLLTDGVPWIRLPIQLESNKQKYVYRSDVIQFLTLVSELQLIQSQAFG